MCWSDASEDQGVHGVGTRPVSHRREPAPASPVRPFSKVPAPSACNLRPVDLLSRHSATTRSNCGAARSRLGTRRCARGRCWVAALSCAQPRAVAPNFSHYGSVDMSCDACGVAAAPVAGAGACPAGPTAIYELYKGDRLVLHSIPASCIEQRDKCFKDRSGSAAGAGNTNRH